MKSAGYFRIIQTNFILTWFDPEKNLQFYNKKLASVQQEQPFA